METVTWRGFSSLARAALIGLGVAFAGALLSVLLGLGSSSAHADDGEDPGLTGALTGLVGDATSLVDASVAEVAPTATDAVSAVTEAMPGPVEQPVHAVVQTTGDVVTTVVEPVREAAPDGIVTSVTQPILGAVGSAPVVGGLVAALGVHEAVTDLGSRVDGVLDTALAAVTDATAAVDPAEGGVGTPGVIAPDASQANGSAFLPGQVAVAAPGRASPSTEGSNPLGAPWLGAPTASVQAFAPSMPSVAPLGELCLSANAGSASGGSGSGAWALAALLPVAAHRAWVLRTGSQSDDAPPAPSFDTDVSPD